MEFTEREQNLIELLADPHDRRSKERKVQACGWSRKHIYRLQQKPGWKQAVYTRMRENVQGLLPRIYGSLFHKAKAGDVKASELILKATGEIVPHGVQVSQNIIRHEHPEETLADRIEALHKRNLRIYNDVGSSE